MKRLALLLALFLCFKVFAQDREAAIWHFGQYAGLDFNSLTPQNLNRGNLHTGEGCSTTSDPEGQLRFYTDGVTVYGADHEILANGEDKLGGYFSTQSGLIVPNPRNENQYYVFTVSEHRRANQVLEEGDGLNYFQVSADETSGFVVPRDLHLVTYDENERTRYLLKCSQKLTAVKHPEENLYWVVTHFEDTFYAFKITEKGVFGAPVTSQIGPYQYLGAYGANSRGQIKFSPDGKKLAMANHMNSIDSSGHSPGSLFLFDFDYDTGILSNEVELMDDDFVFAYGVEFSLIGK